MAEPRGRRSARVTVDRARAPAPERGCSRARIGRENFPVALALAAARAARAI